MPDDDGLLPVTWTDNRGTRLTCHLTNRLVLNFCRDHDIRFSPDRSLKTFHPDSLNQAELFDLAYLGTRHCSSCQDQTLDEFHEAHRSGPALEEALYAARAAILNFILRQRLPKEKWRDAARILLAEENAARSLLQTTMERLLGTQKP